MELTGIGLRSRELLIDLIPPLHLLRDGIEVNRLRHRRTGSSRHGEQGRFVTQTAVASASTRDFTCSQQVLDGLLVALDHYPFDAACLRRGP